MYRERCQRDLVTCVEDAGVIPYPDRMDGVREISVGVPDALAGEIDAAVASGDYASPSDVVGEALEQWRRGRDGEVVRLRALVREGLESGEPVEGGFDPADIARRGRERLAAARAG